MSATHKPAGVPVALDRRRLLGLVCVMIGLAAFGLSIAAAAPTGEITATYVAPDLERIVGVEFQTPDQPVRYAVRIFSEMWDGQPERLLFEQSGIASDCGYYALPVSPYLPLVKDQSVVAKVEYTSLDGGEMVSSKAVFVGIRTLPEGSLPEAVTISKFVVTPSVPPAPILAGTPMTFTISAAGTAAGHALTYVIDFGDGSPLMTAAPLGVSPVVNFVSVPHTYALAGTYAAKLTVTDSVDSTTLTTPPLTLIVYIPVTADASSTCGLAPLNVCFTGDASMGTPPYAWTWNFGDGSTVSHEQNPCHAYVTAGTYHAVLSVTDAIGATGVSTPITISALRPLAVNLTSNVTDGVPVLVVNFCVVASNGLAPYTYAWEFGDGMTAAGVLCPQHAYATEGVYTASVTVADSCGETVTKSLTITVHAAPWIRITSPLDGSLQHAQVTLTSTVVVEPGVTVTRVEYYVNGIYLGSSTVPPYTVIWDTRGVNGTFVITAKAYDSLGRTNTTEVTVTITIANPMVYGRVETRSNPFHLRVYGSDFQPGCKIYINATPVPQTAIKSSTVVVAKGDQVLKAMLPKGVSVTISVHNPDGGITGGTTFVR